MIFFIVREESHSQGIFKMHWWGHQVGWTQQSEELSAEGLVGCMVPFLALESVEARVSLHLPKRILLDRHMDIRSNTERRHKWLLMGLKMAQDKLIWDLKHSCSPQF